MIFKDTSHSKRWREAVKAAGAVNENGTVKGDFAASLFILTGLPSVYERIKQHIHPGYIDFEPMLDMSLSTGERTLVALAGNFYNGRFFDGYTPIDIVSNCDGEAVELAVYALMARKQTIFYRDIFGMLSLTQ